MAILDKRQYGYGNGNYGYGGTYGSSCSSGYTYNGSCYGSRWDAWGRWVLAGAGFFFVFLLFLGLACISARRRRRAGQRPYYGTGFIPSGGRGNFPPQQHNPAFQNNTYANQAAPPQYGNTDGSYYSGGYSGSHQTSGVELQAPPHAYQNGKDMPGVHPSNDFAPPPGPPPGKFNGTTPEIRR